MITQRKRVPHPDKSCGLEDIRPSLFPVSYCQVTTPTCRFQNQDTTGTQKDINTKMQSHGSSWYVITIIVMPLNYDAPLRQKDRLCLWGRAHWRTIRRIPATRLPIIHCAKQRENVNVVFTMWMFVFWACNTWGVRLVAFIPIFDIFGPSGPTLSNLHPVSQITPEFDPYFNVLNVFSSHKVKRNLQEQFAITQRIHTCNTRTACNTWILERNHKFDTPLNKSNSWMHLHLFFNGSLRLS